MHPGVNFINMFMRNFFVRKTKKLLAFKNEFPHAFPYENSAGCAICKLHLAMQVATCKSQLALRKKALKKPHVKMLVNSTTEEVYTKCYDSFLTLKIGAII